MYEHPIKRHGLSMNRIIFSNTRMVAAGFPKLNPQQFDLHFRYRTYKNGKVATTRVFTSTDLDDLLPSRKQE